MPRELIFTSVPNGVDPGTSGYCTVAKHKGIDRILTKTLEDLSFYEMMEFRPKTSCTLLQNSKAQYRNFLLTLSICYSGSDHTGRTNYLAHHLIFEYSEIYSLNVTPAEILLFGSGWLDVWPRPHLLPI